MLSLDRTRFFLASQPLPSVVFVREKPALQELQMLGQKGAAIL